MVNDNQDSPSFDIGDDDLGEEPEQPSEDEVALGIMQQSIEADRTELSDYPPDLQELYEQS